MADPRPYERSYSFRAFPDDEQNKRNLGLLLDQQFDDVAGASADPTAKVNAGIIRQVLLSDDPGEPISFVDGVLTIPRGLPGAGVYETWLETHPGGTIDQFLVDMRAEATPELLAARDQAVAAQDGADASAALAGQAADDAAASVGRVEDAAARAADSESAASDSAGAADASAIAAQASAALVGGMPTVDVRTGLISLENIAGTGNAITASIDSAFTAIGVTAIPGVAKLEYIPTAENTADNPTITIGGTSYDVRSADGSTWPARGFKVGRSYIMRRRNTVMRVIGGDFDAAAIEYRGARIYSSRADALSLLTSNPPPAQIHRVYSIEGERQVVRARNEPNNDPLFAQAPFWGIEYTLPLAGSAAHPLIRGDAVTFGKAIADYGSAAGMEVNWQISDTGVGTSGWSVIASGDSLIIPEAQQGKYLRFRTRGAATGMGWAISNVIGPIAAGSQYPVPMDVSAALSGFGASRSYLPTLPAAVEKMAQMRGGVGAGPPLDLYRDTTGTSSADWLGQVTAPLPVAACNLLTTYSPAGNVIHPCVTEFFNDFCGYRYVCAITAYPTGPSLEDPFVYGSNDRMNWTFLGGAPQPLDVRSATTGSYNSDTFLTHDPRTGELIVGWRRYEPRDNTSSAEANSDVVLMCRASRNGYAWSAPREIMRIPADQQIMLAPTMIMDPETGTWHMWVINRPVMNHWTAPSLYGPWTLDAATTSLAGFDTPHHHEVKWVGNRLVCLLYARGNGQLYFGSFAEGSWTNVTWNMTGVLNPRPTSLYKASFVPVFAAGSIAFDLWWTEGAAGPAGGTNMGHGRKLQYSRTSAYSLGA